MGWTKNRRTIISLAATVAAFFTLSACTPERESPLEFGARATVRAATPTPTPRPDQPTPTPVPAEEMERVARERSDAYLEALYEPTEGTVRMGIWDDKRVQLDSHLAGYVIVYGYDYAVEMVETTADEYPGLLETGELDIVLQTSPDLSDWLAERLKDGAVLDVGTMVEATPGTRIVVHGRLTERAPQIVDFLKSITADDEVFDSAAARITGGRLGINPNVAALTVLKNHEDLWTQWAPAEVVERVKGAIEAGKSDLKNRKCIPTGGGGTTPNCRGWTGDGADDEVFDSAAVRITGGRLGINPNVAALTVLKNHEDLWTQWAPAEVVERVKGAIAAGKSDLKNRKCIPTGGGGTTPNCRGWTGDG